MLRRPLSRVSLTLSLVGLTFLSAPTIFVKGYQHCTIHGEGIVKCWGRNDYGQLGIGRTGNVGKATDEMGTHLESVDFGPGRSAVQVAMAMGGNHNCAILDNKKVACWGWNSHGQIGNGEMGKNVGDEPSEMGENLTELYFGNGREAKQLALGYVHSCALTDDGLVWCWGRNNVGQLGLGHSEDRVKEPTGSVNLGQEKKAVSIIAGGWHTCALLNTGDIKCWGNNYEGALGIGRNNDKGGFGGDMGDNLAIVDLGRPENKAKLIIAMGKSTCAILDVPENTTFCWGENNEGQLGREDSHVQGKTFIGNDANEMGSNLVPVNVGPGRSIVTLSTGWNHACAVLDNYSLVCWGLNDHGQLGRGDTHSIGDHTGEMGNSLVVVDFGTVRSCKSVHAQSRHTCAVLDDDSLVCWGRNEWGQLGIGSTNNIGDQQGEMSNNLVSVDLGHCSTLCPNSCSGHGTCGCDGTCSCASDWTGASDCSCKTPETGCGNGDGTFNCATGKCNCATGWIGDKCDCSTLCPNSCSSHGTCQCDGTCACHFGWKGHKCDTRDMTSTLTTTSASTSTSSSTSTSRSTLTSTSILMATSTSRSTSTSTSTSYYTSSSTSDSTWSSTSTSSITLTSDLTSSSASTSTSLSTSLSTSTSISLIVTASTSAVITASPSPTNVVHNCTSEVPYYCQELESCVSHESHCHGCPSNGTLCWNGECRNNATDCSCPPLTLRCASNGECKQTLQECSCPNAAPHRCVDGVNTGLCVTNATLCNQACTSGVQCFDGTCASDYSQCPCPPTSPYECPSGKCSSSPCEEETVCPSSSPVKCWENSCVLSFMDCPCPNNKPFKCSSGSCSANLTDCVQECGDMVSCWDSSCASDFSACPCPPHAPVKCSDSGLCVEKTCPSQDATCPDDKPVLCWNSDCATDFAACECPPDKSYKCDNGLCVQNTTVCASFCLPSEVRCWDMSCADNYAVCPCPPHVPLKCDDGLCSRQDRGCGKEVTDCPADAPVACWDRSCAGTFKACPCPASIPFRCAKGQCSTNQTMCPEYLACPTTAPHQCWNSECVASPSECPCPPHIPYRCADGFCKKNVTLCVENGCPVNIGARCWARSSAADNMVIESNVAVMAVPPGAFGAAGDDIPIGMDLYPILQSNSSLTKVVDLSVPLDVIMPFPNAVTLEFPNTHNVTAENVTSLCLAFHNGLTFQCASNVDMDADTGILTGHTDHFTAFTIMERDKAQHVDASNPVPERLRRLWANRRKSAAAASQAMPMLHVSVAIATSFVLLFA